jgi:peroxiredoxin
MEICSANLKPSDLERVKVGNKAPDFTLENMDGQKILRDYFGESDE